MGTKTEKLGRETKQLMKNRNELQQKHSIKDIQLRDKEISKVEDIEKVQHTRNI